MDIRDAAEADVSNIFALAMCVWVDTYARQGVCQKIADFIFSEFTEDKILNLDLRRRMNGFSIYMEKRSETSNYRSAHGKGPTSTAIAGT